MVEQLGSKTAGAEPAMNASLREQLAAAEDALANGDAAGAERQAKAISALVRAARDVAEFEVQSITQAEEEDADALRAELRRRIAQFVEADLADAPPEVLERIAMGVASE